MNKNNQPLLFSIQLAMVASLYIAVIAGVNVLFSIINIWWFDPAANFWEYQSATGVIRYGIATLIVFAPIYFGLLYYRQKTRSGNGDQHYLSITQWLIYISLVVVGGAIAFQFVSLILAFLEGEMTIRLLLKALGLVGLVLLPALYHWYDLQGYWHTHTQSHRLILASYIAVFCVLIGFGIYTIESPTEARERSLDQRQLQDLQDISWRVDDYVRVNGALPNSLQAIYQRPDDLPTAPPDRSEYTYRQLDEDDLGYELCATFYHPTHTQHSQFAVRPSRDGTSLDWSYEAGEWCFDLRVNLD